MTFFVSVSSHLPKVDPAILAELTDDYSSEFWVDPIEVENCLARINTSKAPGPDGIPSWFLRDVAPYLHWQPFSMHLSEKGLCHLFGNPPR